MSNRHDGKLDEDGSYQVDLEGRYVQITDHYDEFIEIDVKQALSLLAWLEQERETLQRLAGEDKT